MLNVHVPWLVPPVCPKNLFLSNAQKHNRRTQHYQSAYSACNRLHITIESKTGSDDVAFSWQKKIIICSCGHTLQAQGTVFTITLFVHCRYLKECPQGYRRWRPITYNGKKETETAEIKMMAPTHQYYVSNGFLSPHFAGYLNDSKCFLN